MENKKKIAKTAAIFIGIMSGIFITVVTDIFLINMYKKLFVISFPVIFKMFFLKFRKTEKWKNLKWVIYISILCDLLLLFIFSGGIYYIMDMGR